MEGHSIVSSDVLARYAADAAGEVPGVAGLVDGPLRKGGVKVSGEDAEPVLELHVALEWGAVAPDVGQAVQQRVADYLGRMAAVRPKSIDVVVAEVVPPAVKG